MANLVVYTNLEGGMSIMIPSANVYVPDVEGSPAREAFETFNVGEAPEGYRVATLEEIAARDVPPDTTWHIVDSANIPEDRYFRDAWKQEDGAISVDMNKAVDVHKNFLREQRAPLMEALDVKYMRADETGNGASKTSIAARKQALRDITSHSEISSATTLEELKSAALSVLEN